VANPCSVVVQVHEIDGPPEDVGGLADRGKIDLGRQTRAISMSESGRNSPRTGEPKTKTCEEPMPTSMFAASRSASFLLGVVGN